MKRRNALTSLVALAAAVVLPLRVEAAVTDPAPTYFDPVKWGQMFGGGARVYRQELATHLAVSYVVVWPDRAYQAILLDPGDDEGLSYPRIFQLLSDAKRRKPLDLGDETEFTVVKLRQA